MKVEVNEKSYTDEFKEKRIISFNLTPENRFEEEVIQKTKAEEAFKKYDDEVEKYEAKATVEDYFNEGWKAALESRKEYEEKLLKENTHLHNKCAMYQNECARIEKERHPELGGEKEYEFRKHLNYIMDFTADHENCRECFHYFAMVTNIIKNDNGECTLYPCEQCDWNDEWLERSKHD